MSGKADIERFLSTLRRLLTSGKYEKVILGCREILGRDPANEEAQALLQEAEKFQEIYRRESAPAAKPKSLACPQCGASTPRILDQSQSAGCSSCGAVFDTSAEPLRVLGENDPRKFPPRSFLRLGLEGTLLGKKAQIIGRLCYRADIREWDDEDGCYTNEAWSFEEWLLVTEDKQYLFIEEDDEGWRVFKKFVPSLAAPVTPASEFIAFSQTGRMRVLEYGRAELQYFEGEFTWIPAAGDGIRYAEARDGKNLYAVEWSLDDQGQQEEVEFFQGIDVGYLSLLAAFNQHELLEQEKKLQASVSERRVWAAVPFLVAAILLAGACYAALRQPKRVFAHHTELRLVPEDGLIVGPFIMARTGRVYQINLTGSLPDNSSAWVGAELLDDAQAAINTVEGDFWRESGYDDEGHWSESDLRSNTYFRLEKPGTYYARIFWEKESAPSGQVTIQVFEGVLLVRYFLLSAFAAGSAGFLLLLSNRRRT